MSRIFKIFKLVFIAALIEGVSLIGTADTIHFKNGTRLDIEKAWEEDGKIKCMMFGNEYEYKRDDVDSIERNGSIIKIEAGATSEKETTPKDQQPESTHQSIEELSLVYHKEARLFSETDEWEKAIRKEKQAYMLNPEQKEITDALSYYYTMYAMSFYREGQIKDTLTYCNEALKITPGYPLAKEGISYVYVTQAQSAYDQRDYDSAEIHLQEASRYYSQNPTAYILSGKIAYEKDKYDEAKQEWQKALDIDPNLDEVKVLLQKFSQEHRVEEDFEKMETGNFIIKFEGSKNNEIAQKAIAVLNEAYLDVGNEFGEYPKHEIEVIIYPKSDIKELDYYPDIAAGVYDGKIRFTEDLFNDETYLKAVLYHEYTHVIVHILGGRNVPIWLNEGLAEYSARKYKSANHIESRDRLLKTAAKKNRVIPFQQLSVSSLAGLKRLSYTMIALLYAQSDSFVTYSIEKFTINDMRDVLEFIAEGGNVESALIQTVNYSLEELEIEWKESLLKGDEP